LLGLLQRPLLSGTFVYTHSPDLPAKREVRVRRKARIITDQ
jgi:hypothetical protein